MTASKVNRYLPIILVTSLLAFSLWFTARGITNVVLLFKNYTLRTTTAIPLMGNMVEPSLLELAIASIILVSSWLLATKIKVYQGLIWRLVFFFVMVFGIIAQYLWNIIAPVYHSLVPYLEEKASLAEFDNPALQEVLVGDTNNLMLLIMSLPAIVALLLIIWLGKLVTKNHEEILEWFKEYEFTTSKLQFFFKGQETEKWPDVALGPEKKTKELVIQKGKDRTLNNVIIGPIGTGKTSSLILPIINQDLHHMTKMINEYPNASLLENYDSEDVKGMFLNGLSIIEPSNDLCQKAYQLVQAHGIPDEAVFYIDPTNPETKAINPLKGPVEKVAEAVTMVIEGIGENTEFFFEQSQRNHLKYYIYLLKLHDETFEPTFSDLIRMYNNAQVVRQMHLKLKETIPKDWQQITDRDIRNHWEIVVGIDEWFNMNLLPMVKKAGQKEYVEKVKSGEFYGQDMYYDAKAEYVVGLRNILDDISSNKLMRRVLFDKSEFDFDKHLEFGGVLLLNTAKGELGNLSNVLGKFVLLSLQNAVFRRRPNVSAFHHIICDEFPDYVYQPFKEFPAQSRKYKTIITVASQTLSQLADKYGDHYMQTLLGTLRHKMVFGDLTPFDADLFSKQMGEDKRFEESENELTVSPLQENPSTRMGSSYSKVREARMSPDDLIFQKAFECSVKLVEDNEPVKVRQLTSNFVNKSEFKEAIVKVDEVNASIWLEKRRAFLNSGTDILVEEVPDDVENEVAADSSNTYPPVIDGEDDTNYKEIIRLSLDDKPVDLAPIDGPALKRGRLRTRVVEIEADNEQNHPLSEVSMKPIEEEIGIPIVNEGSVKIEDSVFEEAIKEVSSTTPTSITGIKVDIEEEDNELDSWEGLIPFNEQTESGREAVSNKVSDSDTISQKEEQCEPIKKKPATSYPKEEQQKMINDLIRDID
ncbi:type IV secretory system conjugative DNA transfer family protein [Sutcliffiella cohnii]|uniref:type IV secretory system conjugative DNA transfer family protein n=1 Tax=Sutcliffiella cohnii TaxID=33932 RepID=UPI00082B27B7|nr:type IV secretory system conjugative DNA transfer family protein [Sutcliffiella cohnii]